MGNRQDVPRRVDPRRVDPAPAAADMTGVPGSPPVSWQRPGADGEVPGEVQRKVRRERSESVLFPVASILLFLFAWWLVVTVFEIEPYILPPPETVVGVLVERFADGFLGQHAIATLTSVLMGYAAALAAGLVLGVLMASWKAMYRFLYPPIVAAQGVPKSALAPLFLIWFGLGATSKVVIAMTIAFFPIVISTFHGLRSVPPDLNKVGAVLGLSRWQLFRKIQFPYALPEIFSGLKVAIALAIVGAVVAEFVAANAGLGYVLIVATSQLNTALVFAALLVLGLMGIVLFTVVDLLERVVIPWHVASGRDVGEVTISA